MDAQELCKCHSFRLKFSDTDQIIKLDFGEHVGGVHDYWTGPYAFTPQTDGQEYMTQGKTMTENIVIDPIPYEEVSNPGGGYTAIIAGDDPGMLSSENTISKVIYGGSILTDLTRDTVSAEHMYKGTTAHQSDGTVITGTAEVVVDDETMVMPEGLITFIQ